MSALFILLSSLLVPGTLHVPLTVTERSGVDRVQEWVQSGVPLPLSAQIDTASGLSLLDASGAVVPADFTVTGRYGGPADDAALPIRWLLVSFPCSISAGGTATFHLTDYRPVAATDSIQLTQGAAVWTVDTGAARFEIATSGFDLFHRVTVAGQELISPDPENGPYFTRDGVPYRAAAAAGTHTLAVSRQGIHGRSLTLEVEGAHRTNDSSTDDDLEFRTFLSFFAGSATVRVHHTVQNNRDWVPLQNNADFREIGSPNSVGADEIGLRLKLDPGANLTWTLETGAGAPLSGPLAQTVLAFQDSSGDPNWDLWRNAHNTGTQPTDSPLHSPASYVSFRGFQVREGGQTLSQGDRFTGWLDVSGSLGGVAVTVRDFWQNYPKALRASAQGELEVPLFPGEFRARHLLRVGEQKSHEILFAFHPPGDPRAASEAAGFQRPLLALASSAWYAEICRAIPSVSTTADNAYRFETVPKNGSTQLDITPQEWDLFQERHLTGPGVAGYSFDGLDEAVPAAQMYSWMDYGDVPLDFEDESACGSSSVHRSVTGQYGWKYDGDHGLLTDFLRSLDFRFLDYGLAAIRHTSDVDIMHHGRQSGRGIADFRDGGMFGHAQHDQNGVRNPHRNGNPASACGGAGWNGTPTADMIFGSGGLALAAQLTGDPTLGESLLDLAEWTLFFAQNHPNYTQGRGAANALNTLAHAFRFTGDDRFRTGADQVAADAAIFQSPLGTGLIDPLAGTAFGRYVAILREGGLRHQDDRLAEMASGPTFLQQHTWDFPRADLFAWAALLLPAGRQAHLESADAHFASAVRNPASWPNPLYGIQVVWQIKEWVLSVQNGHAYQLATYELLGGPKFTPSAPPVTPGGGAATQNGAPVAVIAGGGSVDGSTNLPLGFDARASSDQETPPQELRYHWDFGDGTTGDGALVLHTFVEAGDFLVRLTVSDGESVDLTEQTARIVFVNRPPVAAAGPDRRAPRGVPVLFEGGDSSDPDGQPLSFSWDFGDGTVLSGERVEHAFTRLGLFNVTLTVSDGSLMHTDRARVEILDPEPQAIARELQDGQDGYQGTSDVRLWSKLTGGNYGAAFELIVGRNVEPELQSLIRFSLEPIPSGALIEAASLELTVTSPTAGTIAVHRCVTPWIEGTGTYGNTTDGATWATRDGVNGWESGGGADFDAEPLGSFTTGSGGQRISVDLTSLVQRWTTGTANDGLVLQPDPSLNFWFTYLAAREAAAGATRPALRVTYRPLHDPFPTLPVSGIRHKVAHAAGRPAGSIAALPALPALPILGLLALPQQPVQPVRRALPTRRTIRLGACSTCVPSQSFNTKLMPAYPNNQWWHGDGVYHWDPSSAVIHRFDLAPVPAGAVITAAEIVYPLYRASGWDRDELGSVVPLQDPDGLGPWDPARSTWNQRDPQAGLAWTAAGQAIDAVFGPPLIQVYYEPWNSLSWGTVEWDAWDATALVRAWQSDPASNHGIALVPLTSSALGVHTDFYSDPSLRPFLQITYETTGSVPVPPQVSGLRATHAAGLTTLTWNEQTDPADFAYRVYRHSRPINASNLRQAELIHELSRNGSARAKLRELAEGDGAHNWVARAGEGELPGGTALHVHTVPQAGDAYYAVTYVRAGQENDQVFVSGANRTASPLAETVGPGRPVLQTSGNGAGGRTYRVYAFWPSDFGGNDSQFAYPFRVTLPAGFDPQTAYPLYFVMSGYSLTYMAGDYSFDRRDAICVYQECRTPYYDRQTGALTDWFLGYRDNLASLRSHPAEGRVRWYGIARTLYLLDRMIDGLDEMQVDPRQAYLWGGSQGGTGALFTALHAPEPWAAVKANMPSWSLIDECPSIDCWSAGGTMNWTRNTFGVLFGEPQDALIDDTLELVWNRLNSSFELTALFNRGLEPPPLLLGHAWNDTTLYWDQDQPGFIQTAQNLRAAFCFQWDEVGHNEQAPGELAAARLDRAFLALNNSSLDDTPPPAWAAGHGVNYGRGAVNGWFDPAPYGGVIWHVGADPASIAETSQSFSATLWIHPNAALDTATVDVTPRRRQIFLPLPSSTLSYENRNDQGALVGSGQVPVDASGNFTIPALLVSKTGNRLTVWY